MQHHSYVEVRLIDDDHFVLRVGEEVRRGDLYYLGIDPRTQDHDCTAADGIRRLLSRWIEVLLESDAGCILYLPFDFSDETTRWLACEKHDQQITTVFGWAPVEGWSITPSDFDQYLHHLAEFRADEPVNPQTVYLPRMVSNLRAQISQLPRAEG